MIAIKNDNLLNGICKSCNCTGFAPAVKVELTTQTVEEATVYSLTVTNSSTIPSGDTLKIVHVTFTDSDGVVVRKTVSNTSANHFPRTDFDLTKVQDVKVTVVTTNGCTADGGVTLPIGGTLVNAGNWIFGTDGKYN